MSSFFIESCITTLSEGITAFQKGAQRLEACSRLETEGMTPDVDWVAALCEQVDIPVRVMIRETEQGFEADLDQMQRMLQSIEAFKKIPIEGLVIGVMKNGLIDRDAMQQIFEAAAPFPITFHKAIDQSADVIGDLEWLNKYPIVDTVLTSGGRELVSDGIDQILVMKKIFKGNIMAGGKITQKNLSAIHEALQLQWYHGRNIV